MTLTEIIMTGTGKEGQLMHIVKYSRVKTGSPVEGQHKLSNVFAVSACFYVDIFWTW